MNGLTRSTLRDFKNRPGDGATELISSESFLRSYAFPLVRESYSLINELHETPVV
jgi:hypothetical protein